MKVGRKGVALVLAALAATGLLGACGDDSPARPSPVEVRPGPPRGAGEADRVEVRSLLIPVEGSGAPGEALQRGDARDAAFRIAGQLSGGAAWDMVIRSLAETLPHVDETFVIANTDMPTAPGEHPRGNVERGLGDTAFALAPGESRVVEWSRETSPLGYRVVLRVR